MFSLSLPYSYVQKLRLFGNFSKAKIGSLAYIWVHISCKKCAPEAVIDCIYFTLKNNIWNKISVLKFIFKQLVCTKLSSLEILNLFSEQLHFITSFSLHFVLITSFLAMKHFSLAFSTFKSKDTYNLEYTNHKKHLFLFK